MSQSRECHARELRWRKHLVRQIHHAVTAHETRVYVCCRDPHRLHRVVQHTVELRGHRLRHRRSQVHVDQRRHRRFRQTVYLVILRFQVLSFAVPPRLQCCVRRSEHRPRVLSHVVTLRDILVPSRVEF